MPPKVRVEYFKVADEDNYGDRKTHRRPFWKYNPKSVNINDTVKGKKVRFGYGDRIYVSPSTALRPELRGKE